MIINTPLKEHDYEIYELVKNKSINENILKEINQDEDWLYNQLNKRGVHDINNVFYADWSFDRGIHIIKYK
ncbi:YetF domain-containing protein [Mammaliicoccus sciuri]|uniref:YetF domain-containing protein n=1 Tax=Mammaliicoccus sciuri TaxID=1296 RepID=UPI0034DD6CA9